MSHHDAMMKEQFRYKVKTWVALGLFVLVGVVIFKGFSFFSHLNETIALQRISDGIAEARVGAPKAVTDAEFDLKWASEKDIFTGQLKDPDAFAAAKKKLELAQVRLAKAQAQLPILLDQRAQTKAFYSGWFIAFKERPFFFIPMGILFAVSGGMAGVMIWRYRKMKQNNDLALA